MAQFTLAAERHRLAEPLSKRISAINTRFRNAYSNGIAIEHEEAEALSAEMRDMCGLARRLEDSARDADAAIPVAYDLARQTADEMKVVISLLAEMVTSHAPDADDQVRCAFVRARTFLEKSEAVFLGKAKP